MLYIYTDGASRGNPGLSACAFVVKDDLGKILDKGSKFLGKSTNNRSEYDAVIFALERASGYGYKDVTVLTDSKLVVMQVVNKWACLNKILKQKCFKVKNLSRRFDSFAIKFIPREKNTEADKLCNQVLDKETALHL